MKQIEAQLFSMQDISYREFHARLIPNVDKERIIGVRTPTLRAYAKKLSRTSKAKDFVAQLPHYYYEENNLHAMLLDAIDDAQVQLSELNRFLPYVDNWATCDLMRPHALFKKPELLLSAIYRWLESGHTYTVRFGMGMLLWRFLDEDFQSEYCELVASVRLEEYYIKMMQAWYFATALAKQPEAALPYLTERKLNDWVHQKTIQKAVESYRISKDKKIFLKSLRLKNGQFS